ncbi:MAG: rubredoxin [candidate division WOR-3 bacterium]
MQKWRCAICGYIYNPEIGDPESGIVPGVLFEELPDSWGCPDCGAEKELFEPYEGEDEYGPY